MRRSTAFATALLYCRGSTETVATEQLHCALAHLELCVSHLAETRARRFWWHGNQSQSLATLERNVQAARRRMDHVIMRMDFARRMATGAGGGE